MAGSTQAWMGLPAVTIPSETSPSAASQQVSFSSAIDLYKACRAAYASARLLGTVTFYQVKRFRLYREAGYSSYHQWAEDFKKSPDHSELRAADMEWLARAGAVVSFALSLDTLPAPSQDQRTNYVLQELGSVTQLKAMSPKIFNKNRTWEDGTRLQDLFPYEFRLLRENIQVPGRLPEIYKKKKSLKVAAEPLSGWEVVEHATEQMYVHPPSPQLQALRSASQAVLLPAAQRLLGQTGAAGAHNSLVSLMEVAEAVAEAAERQHAGATATADVRSGSDVASAAEPELDGTDPPAPTAAAAAAVVRHGGGMQKAISPAPGQAAAGSASWAAPCSSGARLAISGTSSGTQAEYQTTAEAAAAFAAALEAPDLAASAEATAATAAAAAEAAVAAAAEAAAAASAEAAVAAAAEAAAAEGLWPGQQLTAGQVAGVLQGWPSLQSTANCLMQGGHPWAAQPGSHLSHSLLLNSLPSYGCWQLPGAHTGAGTGAPLTPFPWEVEALQSPSAAAPAAGDAVGLPGGARVLDLFGWPADPLTPPAAAAGTDEVPGGYEVPLPNTAHHQGGVAPRAAASELASAWQLGCSQLHVERGQLTAPQVLQQQQQQWDQLSLQAHPSTLSQPDLPVDQQQQQQQPDASNDMPDTAQGDQDWHPHRASSSSKRVMCHSSCESGGGDTTHMTDGEGCSYEDPVQDAPRSSVTPEEQQQEECSNTTGSDTHPTLASLKAQGLVCGTLAEWLQQQLASSSAQGGSALQLGQHAALSRVLVVEEWSDELTALLAAPNNRGRPILVLGSAQVYSPDQPPTSSADGSHTHEEDADRAAPADDSGTAPMQQQHTRWTGTPADWVMPAEVLLLADLKHDEGPGGQDVVASHVRANLTLAHNDLARLRPGVWLGDESINMYLALLQDRGAAVTGGLRSFYFNTHFAPKLCLGQEDYDFSEVFAWTNQKHMAKLDLGVDCVLRCDRLFIPIHQKVPYKHWALMMVDLQRQALVFFDSLPGNNNPVGPQAVRRVKQWLADEAREKLGETWDIQSWAEEFPPTIPKQDNGCDCGVFMLMFCNRLGLRSFAGFDFCQLNMHNLRCGIAFDLLKHKIAATS